MDGRPRHRMSVILMPSFRKKKIPLTGSTKWSSPLRSQDGSSSETGTCESCKQKWPIARDFSKICIKNDYILVDIEESLAKSITKDVCNTLIFLSRANSPSLMISIEMIIDVLFQSLERLEGYLLGGMIARRSAFNDDSLEGDNVERKKRDIMLFLLELSKVALKIDLCNDPILVGVWQGVWKNSPYCSLLKDASLKEDVNESYKISFYRMIMTICPKLSEDPYFKKYGLRDQRSSTVSLVNSTHHGAYNITEFDSHLKSGITTASIFNLSTKLGERTAFSQPECNSVLAICATKAALRDKQKVKRSNSLFSTESLNTLNSLCKISTYDSGISSIGAMESDILKQEKPTSLRLQFHNHNINVRSTCVCSILSVCSTRHLMLGNLTDTIVFLANSRVNYQEQEDVRDLYETFIFCHHIFIRADELINKLVLRCLALFPHSYKNPTSAFKGAFVFLVDVLGNNYDVIKEPTYKALWNLFFMLVAVGRLRWARSLREIAVRLIPYNRDSFIMGSQGSRTFKELERADRQHVPSSSVSAIFSQPDLSCISPEDLASQITLIQEKLYHAITPQSFIMYSLEKEMPENNCVRRFAQNFDIVVKWIKSIILSRPKISDKGKTVLYFVKAAIHALNINNFHLTNIILTAITSNEFYYEAYIQENMDSIRKIAPINEMAHNNQQYRQLFNAAQNPKIPIIYVHDNDIKRIHGRHSRSKLPRQPKISEATSSTELSTSNAFGTVSCASTEVVNQVWESYSMATQGDAPRSDDGAPVLEFQESYEMRKYIVTQGLFTGTPHYSFEPKNNIIKEINNFQFSWSSNDPKYQSHKSQRRASTRSSATSSWYTPFFINL